MYWYALQNSSENDWGTGTFEKSEALRRMYEGGYTQIAVIDGGYNEDGEPTKDAVCVEIIDNDNKREAAEGEITARGQISALIAAHPEVADVEIYSFGGTLRKHTDYITALDDVPDDSLAYDYDVMNEEEYNATILANSCTSADFADWYGDANAKVLVIWIMQREAIIKTNMGF